MNKEFPNVEKADQGSPDTGEPGFVCIGKIHRTHGIEGTVVLNPMTDFPERIRSGKKVFAGLDHRPLTIVSVGQKPPYLLVRFAEFTNETEAAELRNTFLFVPIADLPPLPHGEYYFHQLIGLEAVNEAQEHVGTLKEILETGANDVYVILRDEGTEELVPAIPQYIKEVRLSEKKIILNLPEWL